MRERSEAIVLAALITGVLGCMGVMLAAVIGLGMPFIERLADDTPTPVVIVVTSLPQQVPTAMSTVPPAWPTVPVAQGLCPVTITQGEVNSWKIGTADVSTVQAYIDRFNSMRPGNMGNFGPGDRIPSGVLVATNFDERDANRWAQFPVVAIVHSGSWGLFQTTGEYITPSPGACMTIVP